LFAIGAALAQADIGGPRLAAVVYMVGGVFFSTGGYAGVLLAINAPHRRRDGSWVQQPWRWWAREPANFDYLAAAVLFVGTLVFAINLVDSFIAELTPVRADRLIWSPDMVGCALFLVSGHLALVDIGGNARLFTILEPLVDEVRRLHHLLPHMDTHITSAEELDAHREVLAAIQQHNSEHAALAMTRHLNEAAGALIAGFTQT